MQNTHPMSVPLKDLELYQKDEEIFCNINMKQLIMPVVLLMFY